jgi:iron complex outermembrane recepter protein
LNRGALPFEKLLTALQKSIAFRSVASRSSAFLLGMGQGTITDYKTSERKHVKIKKLAYCVALAVSASVVTNAFAQTTEPQRVEKVEITGSSIKRVADEGALPVQTVTRQEITRAGITSAEQLIARITANGTGADNLSSNVGIQLGTSDRNNNGNSSANLRGLGASSTLVLLNGRRVSTHGAKGNAVDLNSIPLAAVERVEVLKDGASSLYGTDAIGGVINFILRKDYQGAEVTGFVDVTQDGGGNIYRASILGGWGDIAKDGYNLMASLTADRQQILKGSQRSFSNANQPARGLSTDTTGTPFATQTGAAGTAIGATFTTPGTGAQTFNRANLLSFQGKCDTIPGMAQYEYVLWDSPGFRFGCTFDTGSTAILTQPNERTNFVSRGTFKIGSTMTAYVEAIASRSVAKKQFEALQLTTNGSLAGGRYPVSGPYYQNLSAYIPSFDATKPISYRWRCEPCGPRELETTTDSYRVLAGLDGSFGKWDYKLGLSTANSKVDSVMGDGYLYTGRLISALASGKINPWLTAGQTQTAEALALIESAKARGAPLFGGEANLLQLDGSVSGEIMQLPAGPLSIAAGFDVRRERYSFSDGSVRSEAIFQAPFDAEFPRVSRNVKAVYVEAAVPIIRGLEATLAVRHDQYSDFGGTTNPKVALRWTPVNQVLFRGSYNTGFRAPSFTELYSAQGDSPVPGNIADPVLCPQNPTDLSVCAIRPNARSGGNPNLGPEKSKQWTLGAVFSPTKWFNANIDVWEVKRTDRVYELTPQQVIANYTTFPENLVRGSDGRLDGPGGYIRAGFVNAAGDITRGLDVGAQISGTIGGGAKWIGTLDGTYIDSYRSRVFATDPYVEFAGQWNSRDLFVRWKHQASFTYERGPWSATVSQSYTAGYRDEAPLVPPPGFNPDVKAYITYGLSVSYTGFKNTQITAGINNLLNTNPPFTAHNYDFAAGAGWDPRVADPRGRAFTLNLTHSFK